MKVEIKHFLNEEYTCGAERTERVWMLFGIVISRKVYHYPKIAEYEAKRNV